MVRFGRFRGANGFAFMITAPLVMPDDYRAVAAAAVCRVVMLSAGLDRGMLTIWLAQCHFRTAYAVVTFSRLRELDRYRLKRRRWDLGARRR